MKTRSVRFRVIKIKGFIVDEGARSCGRIYHKQFREGRRVDGRNYGPRGCVGSFTAISKGRFGRDRLSSTTETRRVMDPT